MNRANIKIGKVCAKDTAGPEMRKMRLAIQIVLLLPILSDRDPKTGLPNNTPIMKIA